MSHLQELKNHLDFLGIDCAPQADGTMLILDPLGLLDHLTDEDFAARPAATLAKAAAPPVPVHKTHNPVGALQEWTQARDPDTRPPAYIQSENVGTVHAPLFECAVSCDGERASAKAPSKTAAKRAAVPYRIVMNGQRLLVEAVEPHVFDLRRMLRIEYL